MTEHYWTECKYLESALESFGLGNTLETNVETPTLFEIYDERTLHRLFDISTLPSRMVHGKDDIRELRNPYSRYYIHTHPTRDLLLLTPRNLGMYISWGGPNLNVDTSHKYLFKLLAYESCARTFFKEDPVMDMLSSHQILVADAWNTCQSVDKWMIRFIAEQLLHREGYITIPKVSYGTGKTPDLIAVKLKGISRGFSLSETVYRYFTNLSEQERYEDLILNNKLEVEEVIAIEIEPEDRISGGMAQAKQHYQSHYNFISSSIVITNHPDRLSFADEHSVWSIPASDSLPNRNMNFSKRNGTVSKELEDEYKHFWINNIIDNLAIGLEIYR